jgi:Zn-finger nucleic acid-binding protein
MVVFEDERVGLWDCEKCHAQFVAHAMLEALIAGRQQWHRAPAPKPSPLALGATIRYRRCPVCHHWMQRRNFGATSGVVVDVCAAHGVWFDTWELQQVLAFVEAGGLADLRRAALGLPEPRSKEEQLRSARAVAEAIERAQRTPAAVVPEPNVWRVSVELLWELIEQCLRRAK